MAGSLYRTGPGGYKVPRVNPKDGTAACSHWFDGFTTVHKFQLVPGDRQCSQIWYTSYCHVDELIEQARKTGRLEGISFGQKRDPCESLYHKVKSVFTPIFPSTLHSANIGVVLRETLPGELQQLQTGNTDASKRRYLTVTTETRNTKQFDADTLEPLGVTNQEQLHPSLTGPLSAAHGSHDQETGDIFNYNLEFGRKPTYRVFRANNKSQTVDILAEISGCDIRGAYIHSLLLSKNFVILCIWPSFFTAMGISILWERNILESLAPFDPGAKATWLVIDRHHGRGVVKKFKSPAFFCFHTVNAWEEESADGSTADVICELVEFSSMDILHRFYYENLASNERNVDSFNRTHPKSTTVGLARYKLPAVPLSVDIRKSKPPSTSSTAERIMFIESPAAGDLPRFNPHYTFKPHRYVWSVLDRSKSSFVDGLGKTDTQSQSCLVWEHTRHTPGEPIFVPAPNAQHEDEGVVMSVVLNGDTGTSYLLCLDACTMTEIGRADVGIAVGLGFHGLHVPN